MATEESVTEQFQFLGIDLEDDVLKKCVSLCDEYDIDPESLVEQWIAFSVSKLDGASPSIEDLKIFEIQEFSKRLAGQVIVRENGATPSSAFLKVYGVSEVNQPGEDVITNYLTTSPKNIKIEHESTKCELRPATYSPSVAPSAKYAARKNAGTVVHSFGTEALLETLAQPNNVNNILDLNITQIPNDEGDLYKTAMFGFELLHQKASIFDNHISYISQCIMKKTNIIETVSVKHKAQNEVYVAGRIECDADARLNSKCVVLQGTWDQSLSLAVPVDLDNVKQYYLFPGQVVVMKGINSRGDKFVAHEVLSDAANKQADHKADIMTALRGTLTMVIASGPYTTSDDLAYEPLKDLVHYIGTHKPHLVIMMGPFIDSDHSQIKDNTMAETFQTFFEKLLDTISEITTVSPLTKIYMVSNLKDAFHVNIYPTPPYSCHRKYNNVYFVPDPCTLNVNGIVIGLTSTDILMHLSQEEISHGVGGDKLSRLAGHMVNQQSYYPLWPPPANQPVDASLWAAHTQLPTTPHVLVLPSNFRYFVKDVNGCVVVNPEHLTKGTGGGTFAKVIVHMNDKVTEVINGVAAQIVRI